MLPSGDTKYHNDVRPFGEELRQIVIDGRVGRRQDMRGANDIGECRPPPPGKRLDQNGAGIDGHAGEGAEAEKKDAH